MKIIRFLSVKCDGCDGLTGFYYSSCKKIEMNLYIRNRKRVQTRHTRHWKGNYMEFKETEHRAYSGEWLDYDNMTATGCDPALGRH